MHIVDSQVHIWGADTPERPWPPGRAHEAQKPYPISKETLLFQMAWPGCDAWSWCLLPWLKGEDLELVMGRGICEWLGWPL